MKILVAIKRVADYNAIVRPNETNTDVDLRNIKMALNPFCEIAVEAAVQLKEAGKADEVVVVSIGVSKVQDQIRSALAIGADRGIHIDTDLMLEPLAIAKCLKKVYEQESPDLIYFGKQSIDGDNNQTAQLFSAMTNLPQATHASRIDTDETSICVAREIDGGTETLQLTLPAVVSCDLRLNEPRFNSLPAIMKAKKKPIEKITCDELGLTQNDISPRTKLLSASVPPPRKRGVLVNDVAELMDKLRNEIEVIS